MMLIPRYLLAVLLLGLLTLCTPFEQRLNAQDSVVAVDWHARQGTPTKEAIDSAVLAYVKLLDNKDYSTKGGRTLQALGFLAALPRLSPDDRATYRPKAAAVIEQERIDFWPGDDKDALTRAAGLHSSASYHLPLVLLLLEHQQAGALEASAVASDDREMRFGIIPAKPIRKDVVRLLTLLLSSGYSKRDKDSSAFDAAITKSCMWNYSAFGQSKESCISPTGMAAIGLSAAVFGLNILDYDAEDFQITFDNRQLTEKEIKNRLVDVCAHLLFALVQDNHVTTPQTLTDVGLSSDLTHLDADKFHELVATGANGDVVARLEASAPAVAEARTKGTLSIYRYQGSQAAGAYYSACAAYTLSVAARVLAFSLEHETPKAATIGRQYVFTSKGNGKWRLSSDSLMGDWDVELVAGGDRHFSPVRLSQKDTSLDIDGAIAAALNACVVCATVPSGEKRRLRGYGSKEVIPWFEGHTSNKSHYAEFAALHAFAIYKASVVTSDGYTIGRWLAWQELSEGLVKQDFMDAQLKVANEAERKAAALAFAIMTLTRTYRPLFPKSTSVKEAATP